MIDAFDKELAVDDWVLTSYYGEIHVARVMSITKKDTARVQMYDSDQIIMEWSKPYKKRFQLYKLPKDFELKKHLQQANTLTHIVMPPAQLVTLPTAQLIPAIPQ